MVRCPTTEKTILDFLTGVVAFEIEVATRTVLQYSKAREGTLIIPTNVACPHQSACSLGTGGMGGRTRDTSRSPSPTGSGGRPLGSPIQQTARAPPASGRAAASRLSGMSGIAGLESLLGSLGGLGPGGGLGELGGGGFDPGMFGPDFFGPGSDKDKADDGNKGTAGTGAEGGGNDTPRNRSETWSGMGIQNELSDDSA